MESNYLDVSCDSTDPEIARYLNWSDCEGEEAPLFRHSDLLLTAEEGRNCSRKNQDLKKQGGLSAFLKGDDLIYPSNKVQTFGGDAEDLEFKEIVRRHRKLIMSRNLDEEKQGDVAGFKERCLKKPETRKASKADVEEDFREVIRKHRMLTLASNSAQGEDKKREYKT